MNRILCRFFGCKWKQRNFLIEEDLYWSRQTWVCERCGDIRKVWVFYNGTGMPNRFYK